MFEYIDVTDDPSVERKSGIAPDAVARAHALGFVDLGWVAAVARSAAEGSESSADPASREGNGDEGEPRPSSGPGALTQILISRVFALPPDGGVMLALTHTKGRDTISLKTLFEDGHVVSTEERPHGFAGSLVSRAISVPPHHHYDLATFPTPDLRMLLDLHLRRVEAAKAGKSLSASGKETSSTDDGSSALRVVVPGDLQVYIATRKRYREIANPRFEAQQKFAGRASWAVFFAMAAGAFAFLAALGVRGSSAVGAGLVAFLFAAVCGAGSFPLVLIVFAPMFVRDTAAPPPRPARELLSLANDTRQGRVPVITFEDDARDDDSAEADAMERDRVLRARTKPSAERMPPEALARLRRLDTIVSILNSLLLPILGFALMPTLGSAGPTAALGSVASLDAVILFIMKKSRIDLLRERFLPALANVEGAETAAAPSWLKWVSLSIGVLALAAARRSITKGIETAPQWLLVEWGFLTLLFVFAAWRSIKRRHARFDASS